MSSMSDFNRRYGQLKKVFHPNVRMEFHYFPFPGNGSPISRMNITLDSDVIWAFPHDFFRRNNGKPTINRYLTYYDWIGELPFEIMQHYADRPRSDLLSPVEITRSFISTGAVRMEDWGLLDILRAADRRIGKMALTEWAFTRLDFRYDAPRKILRYRL